MPYADKNKQKEYEREYHKTYHQKRYADRRREMIVFLGGICVSCGSKDNLQFDHIDPSTKCFAIMSKWTKEWHEIEKELNKCQLLCASCHLNKTRIERSLRKKSSSLSTPAN